MIQIDTQPIKRVLITGATGYLGNHIVKSFIDDGTFKIRATTTNLNDHIKMEGLNAIIGEKRDQLKKSGMLEVVKLDLLNTSEVEAAVSGCDIVVHSATPTPLGVIKDIAQQELLTSTILLAMKNILRAVRNQGVKRLVLTSSTTCVIDKVKNKGTKSVVNEDDWADETVAENVYTKVKVLQEKMAWEEYRRGGFELTVICPGNMVGPSLKRDNYASAYAIKTILDWSKIPGFGFPQVFGQFVDVRDAAKAHLLAAKNSSANGKRFLIVSEGLWTVDIASFLHDEFGQFYKIKNRKLRFPFVIHLLAPVSSRVASLKTRLGPRITCDTTASKEILGLEYRPIRSAVTQMFYCMVEVGYVQNRLPPNMRDNRPKL